MTKQKWEIWSAELRFDDDPDVSKIRPVLVIGEDSCVVLTSMITSKLHYRDGYIIQKWSEAGLDRPSAICIKFTRLPKSVFRSYIGVLSEEDCIGFIEFVRQCRMLYPFLKSIEL